MGSKDRNFSIFHAELPTVAPPDPLTDPLMSETRHL